jgi:hypothetical protein
LPDSPKAPSEIYAGYKHEIEERSAAKSSPFMKMTFHSPSSMNPKGFFLEH